MKPVTRFLVAAVGLAGWWAPGAAFAQMPGGTPPPPPSSDATVSQQITAVANVEKIDLDKREVTLKSDQGKEFVVTVPESVSRLDNVKPGDKVKITFYESLALSLMKPGEPMTPEERKTTTERMPGQLPGGTTTEQVTTTAKITAIDQLREEVTIQTPTGKSNTIKVKDPQVRAMMRKLKVGDQVKATYTTALATSVTAPHRM